MGLIVSENEDLIYSKENITSIVIDKMIKKVLIENATKMLNDGIEPAKVSNYSGLSLYEIMLLKDKAKLNKDK